ncbi:MAG TPA: PKD domain-containing protein [Propionicimonas sp.]|uniref:PKD domain-containing protein n=1 Tax=Propionicimonas sp. TaxID=1955623 RepID=UPI002F3EC82E
MNAGSREKSTSGAGLRLLLAGALAWGSLLTIAPPAAAAQLPNPAPVQGRNANTVTTDFLPTAQINSGVVWTLKVIGNTVYAGGSFTAARPAGAAPGVNTVPRSNLLAFNLTTGQLTSFAPTFNGQVRALAASPDGTRLYVGGSFTTVNGATRYNIAAFDTATGALNNTFKPPVGGAVVNAIVATNTAVYVGGRLSAGNGVARKNLMAFDTSGVLLGWAPTTDLQVDAMVMSPSGSKVIIGGRFYTVNGVVQRGLAALSPADGSIQPWIAPTIVKNGWNDGGANSGKAGIYSLSTDANSVYGTGWVYANATVGNLEGSFSAEPESGAIKWLEDCHGDTYTSYSDGTNVYVTGHPHDCESLGGYPQKDPAPGNMHSSAAFTAATEGTLWRTPRVSSIYKDWSGQPAPAMVHWFPDWITGTATGQGQAGWVMTGAGDYMVVGGEFPGLNNQTQQGIVRFARATVSGADDGPRLSGTGWTPSVLSLDAGTARITIPGNWDRDDINLTYRITRSGVATPVYTKTLTSYFWYQPTLTFMDTGLTPGTSYSYRVSATDGDGNQVLSSQVSVVASGTAAPAYVNKVLTDGAVTYLRMGDADGGVTDLLGANPGGKGSGVTQASTGAVAGGRGYSFNGTSNGRVWGTVRQQSPDGWSAGIWFRTTTSSGGKLLGFGTSQSTNSSTDDRHLYLRNDGRLNFGVFQNNTARVITSPASYRDGAWHQAVVTSDASGAALYVDGVRVAFDASIIKGQNYWGYYHVGGDNLANWPNRPTSDNFSGDLDEFALYSYALTPAQVSSQYSTGTGSVAPTANFTSQVSGLHLSVDGSSSSTVAGSTITSYSWNFGDGSPVATGVNATHDYAAGGTFPVTLTITDSRGLSGQVIKQVTVIGPHQAPTAAFTVTGNGLTAAVDASASTASDGATLTYAWNWGDGTANGSGRTATHAYTSAGTKSIVLTLTDSLGGTSTLTKTVTLTHADPVAAFTATPTGLGVAVNASASTASDGATMSYSWNWGDGSASSAGVNSSHTYGSAGSFDITLTVTDSLGGSATLTKSVTAVDPSSLEVATATFGTDVASGWGSATPGGAFTTTGSGFSVSVGEGKLALDAKATRTANLAGASAQDVEGRIDLGLNKLPSPAGTQVHANYELRKGADGGNYRLKVRFTDTGAVILNLCKFVGTTETSLVTRTVTGLTYAPGDRVRVAFDVTGSGTTTLKAKAWKVGSSEPAAWLDTVTDTEATLQDAGSIGFVGYANSITNGPITVAVDNLRVTRIT